ncbi:MAG: acetate/propionate family kinase [Thermomicrobiales bacterium]
MSAAAEPLILALNAGSSSLKWGLFAGAGTAETQSGEAEWPSGTDGAQDALAAVLPSLDPSAIVAIGHRVVHGGARFTAPAALDAEVRAAIAELSRLAPLHNPAALAGIDAAAALLPGVPQVAVFDTAFHQTMPPEAWRYALPHGWSESFGIRRFGFHGINHQWCAERASALCGHPASPFRVVTCHLGSGCSLAAVLDGRSVETTMGYTPMDGIIMATRPGSLDPGILLSLLRAGEMTPEALDDALNHRAGLAGLSGGISDMRALLAARSEGDPEAALAIACFIHALRAGIARMAAALGGIDALVFSAGIGEHQPTIREECCTGLGWMGVALDLARNADPGETGEIGAAGALARVFVVPAREVACVARAAWATTAALRFGEAQSSLL